MPLKAVVRKGDPTTGGGVVLGGAETFASFGKPVATLGDVATCRVPGHPSTVKIVEASACHQIHGKGMAYDGCMLSCGCRVLATSQVFHIEVEEVPPPTLHSLTSPEAHPAPAKKEEKAALCAEDTRKASQTGKEANAAGFNKLHDAIKGLKNQIVVDHKDADMREYGAQIYSYDGKYHYGEIQRGTTTQESKDGQASVAIFTAEALIGIPKGAILVAALHTHPQNSTTGLSGDDLLGVANMRYKATHGQTLHGYHVDSCYHGNVWRVGDQGVLVYQYPGKPTKIYNENNVKYEWIF